ncbi:DNA repair protein RecN [Alphaproteobacteria bacterium]|nr:DNA repair protein RecN [Alphaproteobacteria bacterium]
MLCYLTIKNIVLIEKLELDFREGFTVLTGETGAGKSIIVDAISLILGKRSERRLIRKGQDAANVTALFNLPQNHFAINIAKKNGFIIKEEIILRRQILSNGRSQCFLNDEAISLNFMKELSSLLIEVHGQNDQAGLLDSSNHIHILDNWYNLLKNKNIVSDIFFILKEHTKKYNKYVSDLNEIENKKNYLVEDLEELINLDLQDNEIAKLITDRNYLMSIEKIRDSLNKINYFIQGEVDTKGIYDNLGLAKKQISTIIALNIEKFKNLDESIDRAMIELKEVEFSLEGCLNSIDESNLSIEEIEKRISLIRQLSRKHNVDINDLNKVKNKLEIQLSNLSNNKEDLKKLKNENRVLRDNYVNESKILSNLRSEATVKLSQAVNKEFPVLKLDNAFFKTSINLLDENNWKANGIDNVIFQIETNKGSGYESIEKIASGGELSRIMLAIKVSLSSDDNDNSNKKTLIFDEVDTGVGGAVADAIGKRLLLLGRNNQVLAVTHHPQVAAISNHHFKVNKSTNNSFTTTSINNLEFKERIEEVARMLSGEKITDAARNAAESLFLNNKNL